jgi:hypothetical protein
MLITAQCEFIACNRFIVVTRFSAVEKHEKDHVEAKLIFNLMRYSIRETVEERKFL